MRIIYGILGIAAGVLTLHYDELWVKIMYAFFTIYFIAMACRKKTKVRKKEKNKLTLEKDEK